jgi:hypothetical protein
MKSVRQFRDQLTGVRLAAVNTSIWNLVATINQRAQIALNDAALTYRFPVHTVINSINVPAGVDQISLPVPLNRILSVSAVGSSGYTPQKIVDVKLFPTNTTYIVQLGDVRRTDIWVRIEGESILSVMPSDLTLFEDFQTTVSGFISIIPTPDLFNWPATGQLELTNNSVYNEIVTYNSIDRFNGYINVIERGLYGSYPNVWWSGSIASYVPNLPPEAEPIIMEEAQANMYAFWVGHRALYDQWTAVAGQQALDVPDILAMVRTLEDKAQRRYNRVKKAPAPSRVSIRRRDDY